MEEIRIYSREHCQVWGRMDSRCEDGWTSVCWGATAWKGEKQTHKVKPTKQTRSWNWKWNSGQFLKGTHVGIRYAMKESCLITVSNGGDVFMYRKSLCVHGARQGDSETECVVPTQIPSPKPSELVTVLVAGQNTWQKATFGRRGLFWLLLESAVSPLPQGRPDSRSRRQRLRAQPQSENKKRIAGVLQLAFSFCFSPGFQPLRGAVYL